MGVGKLWLREQYVYRRLTTREIALDLGVAPSTVWAWLCKMGIPRRSRTKARPRHITSNGYVRFGDLSEHRLVAEQKVGRRLRKNERPHHINENRADNRPENIMVVTVADHNRIHCAWRKSSPANI